MQLKRNVRGGGVEPLVNWVFLDPDRVRTQKSQNLETQSIVVVLQKY